MNLSLTMASSRTAPRFAHARLVRRLRTHPVKSNLLLLAFVIALAGCTRKQVTTERASTPAAAVTSTDGVTASVPDYSEFIHAAIARNPPGDYNDALALAAVLRPELTPQPEAPKDLLTATIKAIEADIRTLDAEIQQERFTSEQLALKKTERAKLDRELAAVKEMQSEQP